MMNEPTTDKFQSSPITDAPQAPNPVASLFHAVAAWRASRRDHDEVRVFSSLSADGVVGYNE